MNYTLSEIPGGVAGTDRTVEEIVRLTNEDLKNPQIRLLATRLLQSYNVGSKNREGEARALYQAVVNRVRYQKDPIGIETVQAPLITWKLKAGDCDDQVGLLAALAMSVGLPVRLRAVGYSQDKFVHIFPEINVYNKWIPADTTEPKNGFGWRPPKFPAEKIYYFNGESKMNGLGENVLTEGMVGDLVYNKTMDVLKSNWQNALIDKADVKSYLRVIQEGNFPTREPVIVEPAKAAIKDFLTYTEQNRIGSLKPNTQTGLEGLDGFLGSVWKGIKGAVEGAVKGITGGGGSSQPQVVVQQPPPEPAPGFFDQPWAMPLLIGGGILLVVLLTRK